MKIRRLVLVLCRLDNWSQEARPSFPARTERGFSPRNCRRRASDVYIHTANRLFPGLDGSLISHAEADALRRKGLHTHARTLSRFYLAVDGLKERPAPEVRERIPPPRLGGGGRI